MPKAGSFEEMLTGEHSSSLELTLQVVAAVSAAPARIRELIDTLRSPSDVVQLRVSGALKRLSELDRDFFATHMDYYLDALEDLAPSSAEWTRAQIALELNPVLTVEQRSRVTVALQGQLERAVDWVVIVHTLKTLVLWAVTDRDLSQWLRPHAVRHAQDPRKTVSSAAKRALETLSS